MACGIAHSAVWQKQTPWVGRWVAYAQSARRVLRSTTADAGRYVTAQRSTEAVPTIAMRRAMRAHIAIGTTTDVYQTVARGIIVATATPGWLTKMDTAALIAHRVPELVQRAAPVQPVQPANA